MGCIEIATAEFRSSKPDSINRNMGCIEIKKYKANNDVFARD